MKKSRTLKRLLVNRKEPSLTNRTLSGMAWLFSGAITKVLLQFMVLGIMARLLSPEDYGLVGAAMIVISFSMLFARMGVGPALVQRQTLSDEHITTAFTLCIIVGLGSTVVLYIISPLISSFFAIEELTPILRVLSIVFIIQSFSIVAQALIERKMKFKWLSIREVIAYAFGYGLVGLFLALLDMGVWALVGAHLGQAIVATVILMKGQPHKKKMSINSNAFKDLLRFGGGISIATFFNTIALQADNIIVGKYLGAQALGIYSRSYQIMTMPVSLFGKVVSKTLFPAMSKIQHDKQKLQNSYRRGIVLVGLLCFPFSAYVYVMAPEIVLLLLGNGWNDVIVPLQILSIGSFFRVGYKISNTIALAKGQVYQLSWRYGINAGLILIGSYVGHFWGISGVALGVLGSLIMFYIFMAWLGLIISKLSLLSFLQSHVPGLFLGIVVYVVLSNFIGMTRMAEFIIISELMISIALFSIIIFLYGFVTPFMCREDKLWVVNVFWKQFIRSNDVKA